MFLEFLPVTLPPPRLHSNGLGQVTSYKFFGYEFLLILSDTHVFGSNFTKKYVISLNNIELAIGRRYSSLKRQPTFCDATFVQ